MQLTDKQKHDIADRLALWVSASMDLHAANDIMRKLIREWLDFQTEGSFPLSDEVLTAGCSLPKDVSGVPRA